MTVFFLRSSQFDKKIETKNVNFNKSEEKVEQETFALQEWCALERKKLESQKKQIEKMKNFLVSSER